MNTYKLSLQAIGRIAGHYAGRLMQSRTKPLWENSDESQVLCEGAEIAFPDAFFLNSHLSRIRGARNHTSDEVIKADLHRKTVRFKPVTAHWFRNSFIIEGSVFVKGCRREMRSYSRSARPSLLPGCPVQMFDSAVLSSLECGSTWWGHWLWDELPLEILASRFGRVVAIERPLWQDEQLWRGMIDQPEPTRCSTAFIKNLVMIDEFAQNPSKTRRYHSIRERVLAESMPNGRRVYLRRGNTGESRILVNEQEIIETLSKEGYEIADVANGGQHVVEMLRSASLVVSVEGSHLAPALYLLETAGSMVVLNPPYRVATTIPDIGYFCGLDAGTFICEPYGKSKDQFVVDCGELLRFIDSFVGIHHERKSMISHFVETVLSLHQGP
jgi:hypothetical protein